MRQKLKTSVANDEFIYHSDIKESVHRKYSSQLRRLKIAQS